MVREDKLSNLSMELSVEILQLTKKLHAKHETINSNQIGRSATSICANIAENKYAHGRADFIAKLEISLKETNETSNKSFWEVKGGCPCPIPSQFASAPPPKEKHYAASTPLSKTYFGTAGKVLYTNLRCRGIASAMPEEIIKVAKAENVYQVRAYCDIGMCRPTACG